MKEDVCGPSENITKTFA